MVTVEFGKHNEEVILLLHGGGLSWWNYRDVAELLKEKYHVVIPLLPGHAGSDKDFTRIEECAKDLITYIDHEYGGTVAFIGGLSLGGQILVEMLSVRSDICRYALIESALVTPMKLTHALVKPMMDSSFGLIKKEWFARLQFKYLKMKADLFEDYYRDTCKITKENMISFLKANSNYFVKKGLAETKAQVSIFAGKKEMGNMIQSARLLHEIIPGSSLTILDGLCHGEFSINDADEYARRVEQMMEEKIR